MNDDPQKPSRGPTAAFVAATILVFALTPIMPHWWQYVMVPLFVAGLFSRCALRGAMRNGSTILDDDGDAWLAVRKVRLRRGGGWLGGRRRVDCFRAFSRIGRCVIVRSGPVFVSSQVKRLR